MAVSNDIVDALVTILNAGSFSLAFTAVRSKRPSYELKGIDQVQVVLAARATDTDLATRAKLSYDHLTEIAIFQQLASLENADVDPLDNLVEEIADALRFQHVPTSSASFKALAYETQTDEDELHQRDHYFALLSVVHQVTR